MAESPSVVTELLQAWNAGDQNALERLMPLVYAELRRVAQNQMRHETPGLTLQPTALVNEAYLRLVQITDMTWHGRAHFFAMCSRLMRQILVDAARARRVAKRGAAPYEYRSTRTCFHRAARCPTSSRSTMLSRHSKRWTLANVESSNCVSLPA